MSLPNTIALTSIADGSSLTASPVRNNFSDVQTAVNGLISDLDDGALDGDALVWDATNSKWIAASKLAAGRPRAPRVVTSAMSGGPPASPVDGDIWIASAVDNNGTRWQFQYNAGSSSAYKWEFIGGAPTALLYAASGKAFNYASFSTASPWYWYPTFSTWTVPRSGDWLVRASIDASITGSAQQLQLAVGAFTAAPATSIPAAASATPAGANEPATWPLEAIVSGVTAATGTTVGAAWTAATPASALLQQATVAIVPVRVS